MIYNRSKIQLFSNLLVLFIIFLVVISCGSNKSVSSSENMSQVKQTPEIVFINYAIKKDDKGNYKVEFRGSKKVEGKLKNQKKILDKQGISGDLICSQFDASSSTLSQQLIKNPLKKTVEYVDENKNFKIANIELDSAEFTVRLQLFSETKYIAINFNGDPQRPPVLTKVSEL